MSNKAHEIIQSWYASAEEIKARSLTLLMEYPQIDGPLSRLSDNLRLEKASLLGYVILSFPITLLIALYFCGGKIRFKCDF